MELEAQLNEMRKVGILNNLYHNALRTNIYRFSA